MSDATPPIIATCTACGRQFRIRRELAGRSIRCKCNEKFTVPKAPPEPEPGIGLEPEEAGPIALEAPAPPPARRAGGGAALRERCRFHADVASIVKCRLCSAAVCAVCNFAFDGGLNLCPRCATSGSRMSAHRKKMAIWALSLGGATLAMPLVILGAAASGNEAVAILVAGLLFLLGVLANAIGLSLGVAALSRHGNPPLAWAAAIVNIIPAVVWIIMLLTLEAGVLVLPDAPPPEM